MRDFRELVVWQKAMSLFGDLVEDVETFPKAGVARIISNQVLRSVSSASADIAEGYGRRKGKEYEYYLYISRGSANESLDWYEKLKRLNYISIDTFNQREELCEEIRAMLTSMINKLEDKR